MILTATEISPPPHLPKLPHPPRVGHILGFESRAAGLVDAEFHEVQLLDGGGVGAQDDGDAALLEVTGIEFSDRLVYDLYGLTEKEIRIVEGDAGR